MSKLPTLTRPQKAAAILVAMGKPSAGRLLKFFKQEELRTLIEGARMLKTIPQSDLEKIVAEFESEFAEGAGLLDSADTMDHILSESMTPEEVDALMAGEQATVEEEAPQPIWPQVEQLAPERLGAFLEKEHPQTAAMILCQLKPQSAANALVTLPKAMRGEVVKRMIAIGDVPGPALAIVENQIRANILTQKVKKDTSAGQVRVASVLNELEKDQIDEMLQDVAEAGASDLDKLRARLFSFDDIIKLSQKARVTLFDGVSTEIVTMALRGASEELTEAILSAIGARSRRMIESELAQDAGNLHQDDNTRARRSIASTAIRLGEEGSIEIAVEQDEAA